MSTAHNGRVWQPNKSESKELLWRSKWDDLSTEISEQEQLANDAKNANKRYQDPNDSLHSADSKQLLDVSDQMADMPGGFYDLAAAEARFEYICRNRDDMAEDHVDIACTLLESSISRDNKPSNRFRKIALYKSSSLFLLPNNTDYSDQKVSKEFRKVREQLVGLTQAIGFAIKNTPAEDNVEIAALRGLANEITILIGLNFVDIYQQGFIALPSFRWQDKSSSKVSFKTETGNSAPELTGFDVGLVGWRTGVPRVRVQVKSSRSFENINSYMEDIRLIYASDFAELLSKIDNNGSSVATHHAHNLYELLCNTSDEKLIRKRIFALNKELIKTLDINR